MHARLRRHRFTPTAGLFIFFFAGSRLLAQPSTSPPQKELVLGTWILDLEKSSYDPGPPPKSQTRTYEAVPEGIHATIETVDARGQSMTASYTAQYDSLEYPLTGSATVDAIALKKVNDRTAEATLRHARTIIGTARRVISEDGRMMTITFRGNGENGRAIENVAVYRRQDDS